MPLTACTVRMTRSLITGCYQLIFNFQGMNSCNNYEYGNQSISLLCFFFAHLHLFLIGMRFHSPIPSWDCMAWVLLEHVESQIIVCTIWRCGCSLWLSNQNDCQRVKATHRLIPAGINLQILLFRVTKKSKSFSLWLPKTQIQIESRQSFAIHWPTENDFFAKSQHFIRTNWNQLTLPEAEIQLTPRKNDTWQLSHLFSLKLHSPMLVSFAVCIILNVGRQLHYFSHT